MSAANNQYFKMDERIWYSYEKRKYEGSAPWFYSKDHFEWVQKLENQYPRIKEEIVRALNANEKDALPYFNREIVDENSVWKTLFFYFWGQRNHKLIDQSPWLEKVFMDIPGFTSCAISKLEARSEIKWHPGDTSGIIRCHLPLIVPAGLPECGFQVEEEERAWVEGKLLMFCDAHRHRAFNRTNQDRIVLIIDVIHPGFSHHRRSIRANGLSIIWAQKILGSASWLSSIKSVVRFCCLTFAYIYLPLQRNLKFL